MSGGTGLTGDNGEGAVFHVCFLKLMSKARDREKPLCGTWQDSTGVFWPSVDPWPGAQEATGPGGLRMTWMGGRGPASRPRPHPASDRPGLQELSHSHAGKRARLQSCKYAAHPIPQSM